MSEIGTSRMDIERALNVASQCRASASAPLANEIIVDDGRATLRELLTEAAECLEEALAEIARKLVKPNPVDDTMQPDQHDKGADFNGVVQP